MLRDRLDLDEKDIRIVCWFMENADISQSEIAERLGISQPSVNLRTHKLKERGILSNDFGINFSQSGLFLSRVDFTAKDANAVLGKLKKCPFFVNGFIMAGKNNVSVFLVHENLGRIDEIISENLRNNPGVSDISVNLVVSSAKDFIFKVDLAKECKVASSCEECELREKKREV
jgi:Lrp/AsnC family leucine-responsive transcriptional regulator